MELLSKIKAIADETGFLESGYVVIENLTYYQDVRTLCEENTCRNYAASWACPPAVGTIAECKARVNQYDKMLLFSQAYSLEDSFDFEGMVGGLHNFKQMVD